MKTVTTLLILGLSVVPAIAQSPINGLVPYSGTPSYAGSYNIDTDEFLPGQQPGFDTDVVVFDNSIANGSFFPGGAGVVLMDWGTLSAGGANDITAVQIGYATTIQAPATVDIILYLNEGATGFGVAGAPITGYNISGLPGSTLGPGLAEALVVDVLLPGALVLPDGPIGWSYEMTEIETGPLTVGSPTCAADVEAGVIDAFDRYTAGFGAYTDTVFFGGNPCASFYMQLTATTECFLVIGNDIGSQGMFSPGGHDFETQVGEVEDYYPIIMSSIPEFVLPEIKRSAVASGLATGPGGPLTVESDWIVDGEFSVQIVMWNPTIFPGQPEQVSTGLFVKVLPDGNVLTRPFGSGTGIDIWAETDVNAEGQPVVRFPFSIAGL